MGASRLIIRWRSHHSWSLRLRLSTLSAPPVFTALRPEITLSAPPEPLVPLPSLMVTMPPPGDTGSQEKRSTVVLCPIGHNKLRLCLEL